MIFPEPLKRGLARGLAGLLLLVSGSGLAQARGESAVWSLKGAHNTVYLAGSVHALPPEQAGFSPQLELAYAAAKVIVMEVDLDDLNPLEAVQYVTSNGTLPAGQDLESVMGTDRYATVAKLAASLELPELVLARLEPWAAAMVLTQFALVKSGFDPQLGIDMQITERAKADGKRIDGLETVIDQLSIFDSRSLEEQSKFLVDSANDVPKMHEDLDRLVSAWRSGDMRGLEKEFIKERAQAPALYDELLGKRNRNWVPQIEALLDEEQDYLVVVGTLHFVGQDGLLELLTRAGHQPLALSATAPISPR
jgi:uncharacterized protein YbaP (TraB family)